MNDFLFRSNVANFLQSSSPDSYQFWELLSQELESIECENELSDFVNHVAEKETQFDRNKVSDFHLKPLNLEKIKNFGLKLHVLEYVSKGILLILGRIFNQSKFDPNGILFTGYY